MGCPNCNNSSNSGQDCGCTSCFEGVMIPVGPQGATGATGPQGPAGATGATGPQGPAGQDAVIPDLVWVPLTLVNNWEDVGSIGAAYAVRDGLMYLRGTVKNDSYTALKGVIFTNAPVQTVPVQTIALALLPSGGVQVQLLPGNSFLYAGATFENLIIALDSVPVIRLY